MSQTYIPIPDRAPGPKYERAKELFDWLRLNCQWREGEWCDTQPIFEGFASWETAQYGMPVSERSIAQSFTALGYRVEGAKVLGVFLRPKDAVPAALSGYSRTERLQGGSAAVSTPHELPILPTDTPDIRRQKEAYNATFKPAQKEEPRFVEHGPMPPKKED